VNIPRLLVVTGALAISVSSIPDDVAAQDFDNGSAIARESSWTSGYMGLGGGLVGAMPRHAHDKKRVAKAPSRPVQKQYVRARHRYYDPNSPMVLVAETLDHTGLNVANLGSRH
jgi:hypothetical protein